MQNACVLHPQAAERSLSLPMVASEFKLLFWGRSMTPHRGRNWLMGDSKPKQDKLRAMAEW